MRRIRTDDYTTYYDYDVFGRLIEEDTGDTVIYNTYDLLGNRMNREVYQGTECISDVSYDYDGNGRMISVNDSGYVADYWYDGLGNCTEARYDDYVYEYRTYNLAGYPESITHKRGTRTLSSFDYVYSVDGNMVEKHDDEGRSTYYTYDDMNRLIREVEELDGDVVQTYEYEFDDFSNRTELYAYGAEDYTVNYWYDANNRLLESEKNEGSTETVTEYTYDDNGNQVEKEVWIDNSFDSSETSVYNGFNQLVSVSNDYADTEYTYGPSGLRLTKTVDNEQIYFINDGGNVIAELYDDEVTAYYLRGLNLFGSFIGNDEYFYLYNAHGDVVNLTDTSGYIEHTYRYDAFGNEREPESSDNNPFRYCGEYYDGETGSYYLRARYYDPVIGRFAQEDFLWNESNCIRGDVFPNTPQITAIMQSGNLYVYCAGNPVLYQDKNGESVILTVTLKVAGGVAVQYLGDVGANIISGETGWAILKPSSSIGDYVAAGVGALIPGSGIGNVVASSAMSASIGYVEDRIRGNTEAVNRAISSFALGVTVGSLTDWGAGKVVNTISSQAPVNYSSYANAQYKKNPAATRTEITSRMIASVNANKLAQDTTNAVFDITQTTVQSFVAKNKPMMQSTIKTNIFSNFNARNTSVAMLY